MKKFTFSLLALTLSTSIWAFRSGDHYTCFDDVSGETYQLQIWDVSEKTAAVRILGNGKKQRFYGRARVSFDVSSEGAHFVMLDKEGSLVEEIMLDHELAKNGVGGGYYADRGDSRGLDCIKE